MEPFGLGIDVLVAQLAPASRLRPPPPVTTEPMLRPAEPRVAGQFGVDRGRVDRRSDQGAGHLGGRRGHVDPLDRRAGTDADVGHQLTPEEPAHGRVRARLGGDVVEGRQEREDGQDARPGRPHRPGEGREIRQVTHRPAARRAQRGQMHGESPTPLADVRRRPCRGGRRDDGRSNQFTADLDVDLVHAERQRFRPGPVERRATRGVPGRVDLPVPGHRDGGHRLRSGGTGPQGVGRIAGPFDLGAERRAHPYQRVVTHLDLVAEAVAEPRGDAQRTGQVAQWSSAVRRGHVHPPLVPATSSSVGPRVDPPWCTLGACSRSRYVHGY